MMLFRCKTGWCDQVTSRRALFGTWWKCTPTSNPNCILHKARDDRFQIVRVNTVYLSQQEDLDGDNHLDIPGTHLTLEASTLHLNLPS